MEKEKITNIGQGIKDTDGEPKVRHLVAVVKGEDGEEREVDLRDIVGSKGTEEENNNIL